MQQISGSAQTQNAARTRHVTVDLLRIVAILSVVFIHTSTRILEASNDAIIKFPLTLFINQSLRFAVPMFFLISGFVLELTYKESIHYPTYFKKRVDRILFPYLFWSFIYYFFVYTSHNGVPFTQALVFGSASYQLYFIPSLLIFYILFPLLHKLLFLIKKKQTLLLIFLLQIIFLYYNYYVKEFTFFYPLLIASFNIAVFLFGMLTSHHQESILTVIKKYLWFFSIASVIGAATVFLEGRDFYLQTRNIYFFYTQWRPSVFLYTISISGLLYFLFQKIKGQTFLIEKLAHLSLFVFFIHVIILEFVWKLFGENIFQQTSGLAFQEWWFTPLFCFVVAIISFVIAYLVHKIPKIKMITG